MSRHPTAPERRPLSQTEELERLEQSITLALQEIDHNFSRAHRIVTSSILPIVEQYAHHSREVWEGSKFWKQFFEASANVSLSGYEEQPSINEELDQTVTDHTAESTQSNLETSHSYETPSIQHVSRDSIQDISLSNLTVSPAQSTPRPLKQKVSKRDAQSPYRSLRRDVNDVTSASLTSDPRTPSRQTSSLLDDVAMTPEESPEPQGRDRSVSRPGTAQKRSDPLLHTILDKKYRIQATPLAATRVRGRTARTPGTGTQKSTTAVDPTLDSSPLAPPELHAEVFDSPIRRELTQNLGQKRTPGVSVLTPGRNKGIAAKPQLDVWGSDDEDEYLDEATGMPYGASPPKTMQFHVPQSRLLKTPAREASKQIVDNILASAGMNAGLAGDEYSDDFEIDLDLDYDNEMEENSPSVVRRAPPIEDETF